MKKWKNFLLIGSILLLIITAYSLIQMDQVQMRIQVVSHKKEENIVQKLTNVSDEILLNGEMAELIFCEESLPFDSNNNTFYLPVSMDNNFEAGEFEGSLLGEKNVQVFFFEDFTRKDKSTLIKENVKNQVMIVSGSTYFVTSLTLVGNPIITFGSTDLTSEDGLPLFEFTLYDTCNKENFVTTCYSTSTIRGNTSKSYDKKSLRLKLKDYNQDGIMKKKDVNLLGMREDDDWILNGLYADDSRIKDKLANELWNETFGKKNPYGVMFGTSFEYVEVLVNNNYLGLYGLSYPIDSKQVGIEKTSTQMQNGNTTIERLYKKKYNSFLETTAFTGELPDANMPDYRGGYVLKGDTILQNEDEWKPLQVLASCVESDDDTFASSIATIVDYQNVLDNYLFYQAIAGFDNLAKNQMYVAKNVGNEYYGYFIPWDLNISFGDVYEDNEYFAAFDETTVEQIIPWEPANRMVELNVSHSRSYLLNTWKNIRNTTFSTEHIKNRMDQLFAEVNDSGAYIREQNAYPNGRYTQNVEHMKSYIEKRFAFLDEYLWSLENE